MYCNSCGEVRPHEAKFCNNCGANFAAPEAPSYGYGHNPPPYYGEPASPPYVYHQPPANRNKALASLVLGLCAMFAPIPVLDIFAAIAGIVLGVIAVRENGDNRGLAMAGLVCSIIGLPIAILFTVRIFAMF